MLVLVFAKFGCVFCLCFFVCVCVCVFFVFWFVCFFVVDLLTCATSISHLAFITQRSNIGSNDGWFGGPGSSDHQTESYCVPPNAKLMVDCPLPPVNFTANFACEQDKTSPCLFNITADPCEHRDLSTTMPDVLKTLTARLQQFRDAAVSSNTAHPNPDGGGCPYTTTDLNVRTTMPCPDNGTKPHPAPAPPSPSPAGQFALENWDSRCLVLNSEGLVLADCGAGTAAFIWSSGADGAGAGSTGVAATRGVSANDAARPPAASSSASTATSSIVKYGNQCLKIFESSDSGANVEDGGGDCGTWTRLHVGVCRGDGNDFTFDEKGGLLKSNHCALKCVAANSDGMVELTVCTAVNAEGWTEAKKP